VQAFRSLLVVEELVQVMHHNWQEAMDLLLNLELSLQQVAVVVDQV
jgi:hypothetical protein